MILHNNKDHAVGIIIHQALHLKRRGLGEIGERERLTQKLTAKGMIPVPLNLKLDKTQSAHGEWKANYDMYGVFANGQAAAAMFCEEPSWDEEPIAPAAAPIAAAPSDDSD